MVSSLAISVFPNYVSGETKASATKRIYQQNCARCHGSDGKATGDLGVSLDVPDLTQANLGVSRISAIVKNGKGSMPSFKKKLSAKDIASVAKYAKSLR